MRLKYLTLLLNVANFKKLSFICDSCSDLIYYESLKYDNCVKGAGYNL